MPLSDRDQILRALRNIAPLGAKAEAIETEDLLKATLPIPVHLNALEPEILLILGVRGAGKSHFFRLLNLPEGLQILDPTHSRHRLERAIWLRNFSTRPEPNDTHPFKMPSEANLQRFATGKSRTDLMDFWRGLLVGSILTQAEDQLQTYLRNALPGSLINVFVNNLPRISDWHTEVVKLREDIETAFNALDDELTRQNRYLFATYDDLDVMAVEWDQKRALIQALLQFWLGQWRRWRRIRPKIFLRLDLFAPEFLKFPDASKLEGNKVVLRWTPNLLYQLVFKIWGNQNNEARRFLQQEGRLSFRKDPLLGWNYKASPSDNELKIVMHRMVGQFMGRGPKKGRTFEWVPNHLQDANGEIFPRSMLNLFALAAEDEIVYRRAKSDFLLSPESFGVSIAQVSEHRIKELEEEYPWLASLKPKLVGQQVPISREILVKLLSQVTWSEVGKPSRQEPELLIEDLLKVGILRLTADQRIHVPDIYLYGFELKRKGGIRRPKDQLLV